MSPSESREVEAFVSTGTLNFNLLKTSERKSITRPDLYKLDMFGKKCAEEDLDFQYPTEAELLQLMEARNDVQLCAVSTKTYDQLYGIQLHFTKDISSRMYETAIGSYTEQNRTNIDMNKRIRKICLRLSDKKSGRRIWGIRFVDENGKKVMSHSWNKAG